MGREGEGGSDGGIVGTSREGREGKGWCEVRRSREVGSAGGGGNELGEKENCELGKERGCSIWRRKGGECSGGGGGGALGGEEQLKEGGGDFFEGRGCVGEGRRGLLWVCESVCVCVSISVCARVCVYFPFLLFFFIFEYKSCEMITKVNTG